MPKPSEVLRAAGWKPEHENMPVGETLWLDPVTGKYFYFVTAVITQIRRDDAKPNA